MLGVSVTLSVKEAFRGMRKLHTSPLVNVLPEFLPVLTPSVEGMTG